MTQRSSVGGGRDKLEAGMMALSELVELQERRRKRWGR